MKQKLLILSAFFLIGVFLLPKFVKNTSSAPIDITSSSWIEQAGTGLIAPACGSSSAMVTCSGNAPLVTFNWSVDPELPCTTVFIQVNNLLLKDGLPCYSGFWTWSGPSGNFSSGPISNTSYGYGIFAMP